MAFRATLNLGGNEYDVLDCKYELKRDIDSKGRPSSPIYGSLVEVQVESTGDTAILEQMVSQHKPCSGSVIFKKGDEEAKMKELEWENGYIIRYAESIDVSGSQPMSIRFTVSAKVLKIGSAQFEQNWPDK